MKRLFGDSTVYFGGGLGETLGIADDDANNAEVDSAVAVIIITIARQFFDQDIAHLSDLSTEQFTILSAIITELISDYLSSKNDDPSIAILAEHPEAWQS